MSASVHDVARVTRARHEPHALDVAHRQRQLLIGLDVDEERLAVGARAASASRRRPSSSSRSTRERIDDDHRASPSFCAERRAQRAALHLLRQRVLVAARLRPEHGAALAPERVADLADARAAGALLPPRLLAAAADERAVLRRVRAAPPAAFACTTDSQIRSVLTRPPNTSSRNVDGSDLLVVRLTTSSSSLLTVAAAYPSSTPGSSCLPFFGFSTCGYLLLGGHGLADHEVAAWPARHRARTSSRWFSASTAHLRFRT